MRGRRAGTAGLAIALALLVTACGESGTAPSVDTTPSGGEAWRNLVDEGYRGRYRSNAFVLQNASHGPQVCLGGVAESLPPQCGGPDLVGWSWAGLPGVERVGGSTYGSFLVTGTYDGTRFTLTEPPRPPERTTTPSEPEPDTSTPCPAPAGGWTAPDPSRATDATFQAATETAAKQPGYTVAWIDQNLAPGVTITDNTASPDPRAIPNDPRRIVLNFKVTRDLDAAEKAVRAVWGGNLCVTTAAHTEAELQAVQKALLGTPGLLQVGPDGIADHVVLIVVRATVQQQAALDARFGAGMVRLSGRLHPIDV